MKNFMLTFLHPNALGFYFYTLGAKKESLKKIIYVPIIMIPYGFFLAFTFFSLRDVIENQVEKPYVMVFILGLWFLIALFINYLNSNKKK